MKPVKFKKLIIVTLMICIAQMSLASDKRSNNFFSLKNFNKNFYKTASPFSLRAGFTFKGFQVIGQKKEANGDITLNSMMRYEKGNTTYIYPYKHKVSVPKFKTPLSELR